LSQQAFLQSSFSFEHETASFLAQHDLFIMEQEEIERRAARERKDTNFIIDLHIS
jgi:hypothetical protein